jgi:thymidylate synthase (FAD)
MRTVEASVEFINPPEYAVVLDTIERVGRTCYKSEDKMTEFSAEDFVRRLIKRGHEAMIEHGSVTLRFINDRGVSHEEVRHRIASFGQESTRYCNYSKDKFDGEVTYIDIERGMELDATVSKLPYEVKLAIIHEWMVACLDAEQHYLRMLELGATPQIARSVLNNSTKTEICITMDFREWRHFIRLRNDPAAHPQMREVAQQALDMLYEKYPVFFEEFVKEY